jgi:hypothetical protein
VAQGLTTLEAAALCRRTVVARALDTVASLALGEALRATVPGWRTRLPRRLLRRA